MKAFAYIQIFIIFRLSVNTASRARNKKALKDEGRYALAQLTIVIIMMMNHQGNGAVREDQENPLHL